MVQGITNYLFLPKDLSRFENDYLKRMNNIAFWFFVAHLPVLTLIAWFNDTQPLLALTLSSLVLVGPVLVMNSWQSKRAISTIMGITAMFMGGLLVHFGQGPVQIEMHFYFFVLLALLAVFANPMVIVAAAITAAAHHATLWLLLPSSVFNYDAPFWVVAVHAAFVVLESVAACFIARSFFDNVIGLEKIVAQRTAEIDHRNKDMRRVLDTVEQGFLIIDDKANMSDERSAAVERLLGTCQVNNNLITLIRGHDSKAADWLEFGLDEVFAGIMPVETTIDQLPKRCTANGKTLQLEYSPIYEAEQLINLAVVITDISAEVAREVLEAENREMLALIHGISHDKTGFMEFFDEAENLVQSLQKDSRRDMVLAQRQVHTLKGNTSIYGLDYFARLCHRIEDYMVENNEPPAEELWCDLFKAWKSVRSKMRTLVGEETRGIVIGEQAFELLIKDLLNDTPRSELAKRLTTYKLEPTSIRLERIVEQAMAFAKRLGKGNVQVVTHGGNLRLEPSHWSDFWSSFVHVIRNSVDHGLETPADRLASGKPELGRIDIETAIRENRFVISITDDGRGIDWNCLREVANDKGLPSSSQADLVHALFADGISTAREVTNVSGRGVGMAAVKSSCEKLGGTVHVESAYGKSTTFRFSFPIESMAPEACELLMLGEIQQLSSLIADSSSNAGALSFNP